MDTSNLINAGLLVMTAVLCVITGVVGLLSCHGSRKSAREAAGHKIEANRIAQEMLDMRRADDTKAVISAKMEWEPSPYRAQKQDYLVITNRGKVTARDVRITVNGKPINEERKFIVPDESADTIGPNDGILRVKCRRLRRLDPEFEGQVCIRWADESGPGEWAGPV